jgi:RNA ligase
LDTSLLEEYITAGYIYKRKHPTENLYILNYSPKTQIESFWNDLTMMCRGLIVDGDYNIVERPFKKFFTLSQLDNPKLAHYKDSIISRLDKQLLIYEKVDGILCIPYFIDDIPYIATRGSFTSPQSELATYLINNELKHQFEYPFNKECTYLFELVHPDARIVVDYREEKSLRPIAVIEKATGLDRLDLYNHYWNWCANNSFHVPRKYYADIKQSNFLSKITSCLSSYDIDKEGLVVLLDNGERVKIKFENYIRLHKILTGLNERHIWELLRNDQDISSYLVNVPDEFYNWVFNVVLDLQDKYNTIYNHVTNVIKNDIVNRDPPLDRKQIAEKYKDYSYKSVLFAILDNKQYKQTIWRLVKPK